MMSEHSGSKSLKGGLYAYRGGSYTTFGEALKLGGDYLICPLEGLTKAHYECAKNTGFAIGDDELKFVVVTEGEA